MRYLAINYKVKKFSDLMEPTADYRHHKRTRYRHPYQFIHIIFYTPDDGRVTAETYVGRVKQKQKKTLISCFRRDVDEICGLLGSYTTPCNYPEDRRFKK
jgi:hypothetical protein